MFKTIKLTDFIFLSWYIVDLQSFRSIANWFKHIYTYIYTYIFFFRLFCIVGYYKKLNYSFLKFIFNWKTIALQCCVGFCYTTTWISHKCTYIPFLLNLLPTPHPTSLGHHRAMGWAPCVIQQLLTSSLFYTWWCIYVNASLSLCPTPSFSRCVHKSILNICISFLPCKWVHWYHLYVCINTQYFFFCLTYFTL